MISQACVSIVRCWWLLGWEYAVVVLAAALTVLLMVLYWHYWMQERETDGSGSGQSRP